jgi:U3 small nucleolar ribonucleoprotein protein IMP3
MRAGNEAICQIEGTPILYYLIKSVEDSVFVHVFSDYNAYYQTLKPDDSFRIAMTEQLLEKLFNMGIISTQKSLQKADEITASAICRRRLPVVMVRLKMAQNVKNAVEFVEQGQVRIGPNVVTDPAFLVTKTMEDFVTWVDSSKVRRAVHKYNDKLDDFDLL